MVPNPFKPASSASESPAFPRGDGHRPVRWGLRARSGGRQSVVKGTLPDLLSARSSKLWKAGPLSSACPRSPMHRGVGMSVKATNDACSKPGDVGKSEEP
jgi:hypothetical protein